MARFLTLLLVLVGWLSSAEPVAAQTTYLALDSEPGDFIGGGISQTFTPAEGVFDASRNFDNGVTVNFNGGAFNLWTLDFAAPGDAALAVGAYENATRFPFQSPTDPGLDVSGQGRGCNMLTGRFEVLEIVYGPGGEVKRFAADFEQHCEGLPPALFGSIRFNVAARPINDFDGDAKTDISVYRGSTGEWFILRSVDSMLFSVGWGAPTLGDIPVPADYDADGQADLAVYRNSTGQWFVRRSAGGIMTLSWGAPSFGDIPVPADYDGDRRADLAVYRNSAGEWFLRNSSDSTATVVGWGEPGHGDIPVPADYDGDGKADLAVYRNSTGLWLVRRSSGGTLALDWGAPSLGDIPVPGDYDGDGQADLAVYRNSTGEWFVRNSADDTATIAGWGAPSLGDIPVPGDYDDDVKVDLAVYRNSTGEWFVRNSGGGTTTLGWGAPTLGDIPLSRPSALR